MSGDTRVQDNELFSCLQRSFFISADMAHAIHPAYPELHQAGHKIKMNHGLVLKINANNRYATSALSGAAVRQICEAVEVPVQNFIANQSGPCGSTIGPMLSSLLGVRAVDVGMAQLGMHSIRETCGVLDTYYYTRFFNEFYRRAVPQTRDELSMDSPS